MEWLLLQLCSAELRRLLGSTDYEPSFTAPMLAEPAHADLQHAR